MPTTQPKKLLNRIYAVLTLLWIAYLIVILPIQLRHRAETRLSERMANCIHLTADHKITYDGECMDLAEHLYVIDKNIAGSYFSPKGLLTLLIAALGIPLTIYGLIVIPAIIFRHLRKSQPSGPPQNNPA
jgi:hypothetical protein